MSKADLGKVLKGYAGKNVSSAVTQDRHARATTYTEGQSMGQALGTAVDIMSSGVKPKADLSVGTPDNKKPFEYASDRNKVGETSKTLSKAISSKKKK